VQTPASVNVQNEFPFFGQISQQILSSIELLPFILQVLPLFRWMKGIRPSILPMILLVQPHR
jgi:hypothetical protein